MASQGARRESALQRREAEGPPAIMPEQELNVAIAQTAYAVIQNHGADASFDGCDGRRRHGREGVCAG